MRKPGATGKPDATRKRKPQVPRGTPNDQPLPGWVDLLKAPLSCLDDGMHTPRTWALACEDMARTIASRLHESPSLYSEMEKLLAVTAPPQWEISSFKDSVYIRAMDVCTCISQTLITVRADDCAAMSVFGWSPEMLQHQDWEDFTSSRWEMGAAWHREFIKSFLYRVHSNFRDHVLSGKVQLFARFRSPFAPFERIFPDQWNFMKLEPPEREKRDSLWWCDPKQEDWDPRRPLSARGPGGERIYSIHVAPGEERFGSLQAKEKCRQALLALVRQYPKRQPKSMSLIYKEFALRFNLSERGVKSILSDVLEHEQNNAWSEPGRLN
jgi:hypothetical protein